MHVLILLAYLATIPAANWMIYNVGTVCPPDGPCLIPVGLNLMAPSGVLMIGLALVLRDAVQERLGKGVALLTIGLGCALSGLVAPPALAIASAVAFLTAEGADMAVYTPLRRYSVAMAVLLSGVVGSLVDSAVFLWMAFGSLDYLVGQVVGKLWMTMLAAFALTLWAHWGWWRDGEDGRPV